MKRVDASQQPGAMAPPPVIAVDLGATKVNVAVEVEGRLSARSFHDEPFADYDHGLEVIGALLAEATRQRPDAVAVAVSVAGFLHADRRILLKCALEGWDGRPLADDLAAACGLPVVMENDGNSAAWGEYRHGSGRGADPFVLLALGSGVGGGIVLGGQVVRGAHGIAAELGHVLVSSDGALCPCGGRGCLEMYGSGRALLAQYRDALVGQSEGRVSAASFASMRGEQRRALERSFAADLARGAPTATSALEAVGTAVGGACDRLARVLDPARFSLGGGLSALGLPLLAAVRRGRAMAPTAVGVRTVAPIVLAQLGNDAALLGVADLARRSLSLGAAPGGSEAPISPAERSEAVRP